MTKGRGELWTRGPRYYRISGGGVAKLCVGCAVRAGAVAAPVGCSLWAAVVAVAVAAALGCALAAGVEEAPVGWSVAGTGRGNACVWP